MTNLVDPKLKRNLPVTAVGDDNLLSKKQVSELLGSTTNLLADINKISGTRSTAMLWIGNTVYGWGNSGTGEKVFGFADGVITRPTRIANFEALPYDIVDIAAGRLHAIVVLDNGDAWISGDDSSGQLGDAAITDPAEKWSRVQGPWLAGSKILKCWAFHDRSFLLVDESNLGGPADYTLRIYGAGRNNQTQVGTGTPGVNVLVWDQVLDVYNSSTPYTEDIDDIIVCGNHESTHVSYPTGAGSITMWSTGLNADGELGIGNTTNQPGFFYADWTAGIPGYAGVFIKKMVAGDRCFGIIGTDDQLYVVGHNDSNTLGIAGGGNITVWTPSPTYSNIKDVAFGVWIDYATNYNGIVAIKNDGSLAIGGNSSWGHLGIADNSGYIYPPEAMDPERTQDTKFIAIWNVGLTKFLLDEVGNLWGFGHNTDMQLGQGFDQATDDDYVDAPQTISDINNARLNLAFQNLSRGYSHPIIPHLIEQQIVQGGGGDYTYKGIASNSTTNVLQNALNYVGDDSFVYPIANFVGTTTLDVTGIRRVFVKIWSHLDALPAEAPDFGDLYVTYPDGTEHLVYSHHLDQAVSAALEPGEFVDISVHQNHSDIVEIPVGYGQTSLIIRRVTSMTSVTDQMVFEIVGCEEYFSTGSSGKRWTAVEKQNRGVSGTSYTDGDWRPIQFNHTIGSNEILGSSLANGSEFTFAPGRYRVNFRFNTATTGYNIHNRSAFRIWNVTGGVELERLPNTDEGHTVDYYGNGHSMSNAVAIETVLQFSVETTIRFEVFPNRSVRSGIAVDRGGVGEEYYTRVTFEGYDVLVTQPTWDFDSGWVAIATPDLDTVFPHNLGTDVFSGIVIQMRDANLIPVQFNGSAFSENRVPGEYNRGYGPRITIPTINDVTVDCPQYGGAGAWLPDHTDNPPGWAGTQPTQIRVLLKV